MTPNLLAKENEELYDTNTAKLADGPTNKEEEISTYLPKNKYLIQWKYTVGYNYGYYTDTHNDQYLAVYYDYSSLRIRTAFLKNALYSQFGFSTLPKHLVDLREVKSYGYGYSGDDKALITKLDPLSKPLATCIEEATDKIPEQLAKLHIISALIGELSIFSKNEESYGAFIKNYRLLISHFCNSSIGYYHEEAFEATTNILKKSLSPKYNRDSAQIMQKIFQNYTLKHIQEIIDWFDSSWDEQKIAALFKASEIKDEKLLDNLKLRFQDIRNSLEKIKQDEKEKQTYLIFAYLPKDENSIQWEKKGDCYYYGYYTDTHNDQYLAMYSYYDSKTNTTFLKNKLYSLFGFSTLTQYLIDGSEIKSYSSGSAIITKTDPLLKPLSSCIEEAADKIPEQLAKLHMVSALIDDLSILNKNDENYGAFTKNDHLWISCIYNPSANDYREPFETTNNILKKSLSPAHNQSSAQIAQNIFQNYTLKHVQEIIDWLDTSWDEQKVAALFKASEIKDEKLLGNLKLRFQDIRNSLEKIKQEEQERQAYLIFAHLPKDKNSIQWTNKGNHYYSYYTDTYNDKYLAIYSDYSLKINTAFLKNKLYNLFGFSTLPQYLLDRSEIKSNSYSSDRAIITKIDHFLKPLSSCIEEEADRIPEQLAKLHIVSALIDELSILNKNDKDYGAFIKNDQLWIGHICNPSSNWSETFAVTTNILKKSITPTYNPETAKIAKKIFQNYTLKHIQEIIAWLDSSWDEQKISALFKDSEITDEQLLTNLKLRFQDIRSNLEKTKQNLVNPGHLPIDEESIQWKKQQGPHVYGYYTNANKDQYLAIYSYLDSATNITFFKNGLYDLFGFSTLPQHLVDISEVKSDLYNVDSKALITKIDPLLKPLSSCIEEETDKNPEQLAKLHIISTLINDLSIFNKNEENYGAFIKNDQILISHTCNPSNHQAEKFEVTDNILKNSLAPRYNWNSAKIVQKIFQNYTLKHIQEIIAWLDSSWNEQKIATLFKDSGIKDEKVLANLKLRFQDIRKGLERMKQEGYEPYTPEKIARLIKEKEAASFEKKFATKNIYYKYKTILPKVEEQLAICTNGTKIWLELTNFEFLVNSKESNNIIKTYIGDITAADNLETTERHVIEIFDPETAFIFSDAIIRYWDEFAKNTKEDTYLKLAQTIQQGFSAINKHFGFINPLEIKNPDKPSFKDLVEFYDLLQQKYKAEAMSIDRFVSSEKIKQLKDLGFTAFYPNPIYLGDIVWYARPDVMNYNDYVAKLDKNFHGPTNCNKNYLSKFADVSYNYCDDYTRAIERWFPSDISFLNATNTYSANDFKRVSAYAFRGDSRAINDLNKDSGFWPQLCIRPNSEAIDSKECKKQLLHDENYWQIPLCGNRPCPGGKAYISTSKFIDITKSYGKNVYVVFAEGGLHLPADFDGKKIYDSFMDPKEIAVPGGINWENILGTRERKEARENTPPYSIGPVFLRNSLAENDSKNFWEILQIMGGKPQCSSTDTTAKMTAMCLASLTNNNNENTKNFIRDLAYLQLKNEGLSDQETKSYLNQNPGFLIHDSALGEVCQNVLQATMGLENYIRRR